jgi:hypothetical protein
MTAASRTKLHDVFRASIGDSHPCAIVPRRDDCKHRVDIDARSGRSSLHVNR